MRTCIQLSYLNSACMRTRQWGLLTIYTLVLQMKEFYISLGLSQWLLPASLKGLHCPLPLFIFLLLSLLSLA